MAVLASTQTCHNCQAVMLLVVSNTTSRLTHADPTQTERRLKCCQFWLANTQTHSQTCVTQPDRQVTNTSQTGLLVGSKQTKRGLKSLVCHTQTH